ncbi:MAG: DUF4397 domain-containing protein [Candidatus Krumholzibacteriia bacterium]
MKKLTFLALSLVAMAGLATAQTAAVQIIHNSPDPLAASVDIYLGDTLAIGGFGYLDATGVLDLPAGVEIVIGVAPGGSSGPEDILATFPVTLGDGESYLVMASGVLDPSLPGNPEGIGTAFNLEISSPLVTSAGAGECELLVYHGSPNAPTVDVKVMGGPVLVDDLSFREFFGYFTAPATDLVLEVTPGGDNSTVVVAYEAPLSALDGAGAVVFAAGYLGDNPGLPAFGLYVALADGTVLPLNEATVATESINWSGVKALFE